MDLNKRFRLMLAKFRVNQWARAHLEDLTFIHILGEASIWLKAEEGALINKKGEIIWKDHREVRPDWAKEFIPEKIWKELIILAEN